MNLQKKYSVLALLMTLAVSDAIGNEPHLFNLDTLTNGKAPNLLLQLGVLIGSQGTPQHINIEGLIGDDFSLSQKNKPSGLVGLGYYLNPMTLGNKNIALGLNAFYIGQTKIGGLVTQESLFTNLSYGYHITNWPIYLAAKTSMNIKPEDPNNITLDVGIGPNLIQTSQFQEQPVAGSNSLPDALVTGQTSAAFSATAGIGYRMNQVLGHNTPLECGYRFYYLGQTHLRSINSQVINQFKTGQSYANALLCAVVI